MNENLQTNPFFAALLDHIPNLEKSCRDNHWIVCVPQIVSIPESHRVGLRLLKMHVLVPTNIPGEFQTLCPGVRVLRVNDGKELEIIEEKDHRSQFAYSDRVMTFASY